jgi:penicillin amidase
MPVMPAIPPAIASFVALFIRAARPMLRATWQQIWRRRPRRWYSWSLLGTALLILTAYAWLNSTLPNQRGNVDIDALTGDVEIVRDDHGVPHIFAPDWRNAYVALGYLHAQDRMWQMELMRRAGAGRLSEVIGPATLKTDRLMRTLGLYAAAGDSYFALSNRVQAALTAYAKGVNAFIEEDSLPLEFRVLGFKPEPWQPADSLVWLKLMAYQLGGSWRDEITAARLAAHITPEQAGYLLGWTQPIVDKNKSSSIKPSVDWKDLANALPVHGPRSASNGWAVSGRLTADGVPQLANDPHLELGAPVLWYLARITTPDGTLTGATAPGFPFHILGQNDELAWGITSTAADAADLYIEKTVSPEEYLAPTGPEPFVQRTEVITIKGEPRELLPVRITRHGPVISGVMPQAAPLVANNKVVSLMATFTRADDTSAEALYWLNRAHTPADIESAVRYVQAPVQNLFFADKRGNIGLRVVGSVPVRASGNGAYPADGSTIKYDWVGVVPRQDLPRWSNPIEGYVGNANEQLVDSQYPHLITATWMEPYRGQRLHQLLSHAPEKSLTLNDHAAWQNDVDSFAARALRDTVLAHLPLHPTSDFDNTVRTLLQEWDGQYTRTATAPLVLEYLQNELLNALLADNLGPDTDALQLVRIDVLLRAISNTKGDWCDDVRTADKKESCATTITAAWQATLASVRNAHGGDPANWVWASVNYAPLKNRFWGTIPVIGGLFDIGTVVDGGQHTLKRADRYDHNPKDMFAVLHGAGYRGIYSAGNPDAGRYVIASGQSGHVLSADYGNMVRLWANGEYIGLFGTLSELDRAHHRYLSLLAPEE